MHTESPAALMEPAGHCVQLEAPTPLPAVGAVGTEPAGQTPQDGEPTTAWYVPLGQAKHVMLVLDGYVPTGHGAYESTTLDELVTGPPDCTTSMGTSTLLPGGSVQYTRVSGVSISLTTAKHWVPPMSTRGAVGPKLMPTMVTVWLPVRAHPVVFGYESTQPLTLVTMDGAYDT